MTATDPCLELDERIVSLLRTDIEPLIERMETCAGQDDLDGVMEHIESVTRLINAIRQFDAWEGDDD